MPRVQGSAAVAVERLGAKVIDLNGLTVERYELPRAFFILTPGRIEGLADVGAIAVIDKTLKVEVHLLPTQTHSRRTVADWLIHRHKGLFEVENIPIGRRECCLPGCKIALELCEHLDLASDMKIGVPLRAADKIIVIVIAADAEVRRVVGLEALPEVRRSDR